VSRLPQVNGVRLLRALARVGFEEIHRSGSHVTIAHRKDPSRIAVVPVHKGKDVRPGTLRVILKSVGITAEQLRELL
jgi:predicted RNA binding protein YcfA (HicA-like mRNA interferase family)